MMRLESEMQEEEERQAGEEVGRKRVASKLEGEAGRRGGGVM